MPDLTEADLTNRKQQLADRITIAEAHITPALAMIPKTSGLTEWNWEEPVQKYPETPFMPVLDGTAIKDFDTTGQKQVKARGMELRRGFRITQQAAVVKTAGVPSQISKQRSDASLLFARMLEMSIFCDRDSQEIDKLAGKPNITRGIPKWLSLTAQGHYPVPDGFRPSPGQIYTGNFSDINQVSFTSMLKAAWKARNGAMVELDGFNGADLQDVVDDFTIYEREKTSKVVVRTINSAASKTYQRAVNFISCSFGNIRTHLSPWLLRDPATGLATEFAHASGFYLDWSMWLWRWIQYTQFQKLANDGSGDAEYLNAMFLIACRNPVGQCAVRPSSLS